MFIEELHYLNKFFVTALRFSTHKKKRAELLLKKKDRFVSQDVFHSDTKIQKYVNIEKKEIKNIKCLNNES